MWIRFLSKQLKFHAVPHTKLSYSFRRHGIQRMSLVLWWFLLSFLEIDYDGPVVHNTTLRTNFMCCANFAVLWFVSIVLCCWLCCVVVCFCCVATCFHYAVLILLWCALFLLCCANFVVLWFVSVVLCTGPLYWQLLFTMLSLNGQEQTKMVLLCSTKETPYRFGTTWGWVNDRIFISLHVRLTLFL